jgi:hypothetical protein
VIKRGYVHVKEEGMWNFIWSKRWMILKDNLIAFDKDEVSTRELVLCRKHTTQSQ